MPSEVSKVRGDRSVEELERELAEALERQTATSEILSVISRSRGELEPVFQAMLANAVRICEAKFGVLFRYGDGVFRPVASIELGKLSTLFFILNYFDYIAIKAKWRPTEYDIDFYGAEHFPAITFVVA